MLHLYLIPLVFALIGLAFYAVLGGADFGAGFWQLTAGEGRQAQAVREHAHAAMAPVWEANHVWLIFVLTVVWTAYPTAFGSIASTLSIPLFIAAVGIIFRGVAYALRAGARRPTRAQRDRHRLLDLIDTHAVRARDRHRRHRLRPRPGRQRRRRPVQQLAQPDLTAGRRARGRNRCLSRSGLSAADATRLEDRDVEEQFRRRALAAGVAAGLIAFAGLGVVANDAPRIFHGLTSGIGLAALVASLVAGIATLALVWRRQLRACPLRRRPGGGSDHRRLGARTVAALPAGSHHRSSSSTARQR